MTPTAAATILVNHQLRLCGEPAARVTDLQIVEALRAAVPLLMAIDQQNRALADARAHLIASRAQQRPARPDGLNMESAA